MERLKGLYLEEIDMILENLPRESHVVITKEKSKTSVMSFCVEFEDKKLHQKMEEFLYYSNQQAYDYNDYRGNKASWDDEEDY